MMWGLAQRLWDFPKVRHAIWMHGASLGECKVLISLCTQISDLKNPIVITTQKVEALAPLRALAPSGVTVCMAPMPLGPFAQKWIRHLQPKCLVLCEGELWPAWLKACQSNGIPVAIVSGKMGIRAAQWHRLWKSTLSRALGAVQMAWFQDYSHAERFAQYFHGEIGIGGDWKLLNRQIGSPQKKIVDLACISIHLAEWNSLGEGIAKVAEMGGSVVLIPRRIRDAQGFESRLKKLDCKCVYWPQVQRGSVSLVAEFGQVAAVLQMSKLALVGGSFAPIGIHNFWEPLLMGVPVIVGPWQQECQSILAQLKALGVVGEVHDLSNMRMGNHGQDLWLENWFPWEKQDQIQESLQPYIQQVHRSVHEFVHWLRRLGES